MPDKLPSNPPEVNALIKLFNLGTLIFVLAVLGYALDHKFKTLPLWTLVGILLGMGYSFYEAWQLHNKK